MSYFHCFAGFFSSNNKKNRKIRWRSNRSSIRRRTITGNHHPLALVQRSLRRILHHRVDLRKACDNNNRHLRQMVITSKDIIIITSNMTAMMSKMRGL